MMDEADKDAQRAFITGIRGDVSEEEAQATTAKPGETGWVVRILDQSGASEGDDDVVEEVKGFLDLPHANAFARAYVRDSIERCRLPGAAERDVLESWFAFGENAEIVDAGEEGWKSSTELDDFVSSPATPMERDWRALDPRRLVDEEALAGFPETAHDEEAADEALAGFPETAHDEEAADEDDEAFVTEIIRRRHADS